MLSRRRIRTSLPKEGWAFVVILGFVTVCSILRNVNFLVVVSGMMFMPLLLCWRLNRHTIRNLLASRVAPNRIHAGEMTSIKWEVSNLGRFDSFQLQITDTVRQLFSRNGKLSNTRRQRKATRVRGEVFFDQVPVGGSAISSFRILFAERGIYQTGPAIIRCDFPLGLVSCWIRLEHPEQIYVAPKLGQLATNWKQIITSIAHGSTAQACVEGSQGDEFFAIREWRSGDNMRKIHWRSTAKYRQPMVRQFERETEQELVLVLDLCADESFSELASDFHAMHSDCELILSFAATVLSNWPGTASSHLSIGVAGESSEVLSSIDHGQFTSKAMRTLAVARTGDGGQLEATISKLINLIGPDTPCLVVSSRSNQDGMAKLSPDMQTRVRWVSSSSPEFQLAFALSKDNVTSKLRKLADQPLQRV